MKRLNLLRQLLADGELSTQEELVEELHRQKFKITQSTVSRDLRRLGAVKAQDISGRTVYRLPDGNFEKTPVPTTSLKSHLLDIQHNNHMIVIHTTPGSASLVARFLDHVKPGNILGTIAGDDTIFVAPPLGRKINDTLQEIIEQLS